MARSRNAAAVQAMWEAWSKDGIDGFLAMAPPDVEWRPSLAGGKALWGSRDIRSFFKAMEERGERVEAEIKEIEEIGEESVLVIGHLRRDGPQGSAIDPMAWLYSFRDGRLWRATAHHTVEEARQAARFAGATLPPTGTRAPVLDIDTDRGEDGVVRIHLAGELDVATAPLLERALQQEAEAGGTVKVDLAGLVFMDSTGMRAILEAHRSATNDGWALRLGRASDSVQRVFAMSGMEKVLPFDPPVTPAA
jgi:anti-sigma B factor antagonist